MSRFKCKRCGHLVAGGKAVTKAHMGEECPGFRPSWVASGRLWLTGVGPGLPAGASSAFGSLLLTLAGVAMFHAMTSRNGHSP